MMWCSEVEMQLFDVVSEQVNEGYLSVKEPGGDGR